MNGDEIPSFQDSMADGFVSEVRQEIIHLGLTPAEGAHLARYIAGALINFSYELELDLDA